ncbi:hypothetical protein CERZMDRAFT_102090 [Cercospora zeae-maydis SCOH1-5]|uniref:Uncharacterized protein n=1 Tax=Cercospora zeae-maydis SCOH1-5 TaxID=717836 RepID=A0A6A6F208_9PEZI|nr:hypothetical protein CERZMDRAFT_102090 [Cercospora zeae-maydis SCOH1-5]
MEDGLAWATEIDPELVTDAAINAIDDSSSKMMTKTPYEHFNATMTLVTGLHRQHPRPELTKKVDEETLKSTRIKWTRHQQWPHRVALSEQALRERFFYLSREEQLDAGLCVHQPPEPGVGPSNAAA